MPRAKRSPIWQIDREELKNLVDNALSVKDVLNAIGLENKGNNYKTLKDRMEHDGLDFNYLIEQGKKNRTRNAKN